MTRLTARGAQCRPVVVGLVRPAELVELTQLSALTLDNETLRIGSGGRHR